MDVENIPCNYPGLLNWSLTHTHTHSSKQTNEILCKRIFYSRGNDPMSCMYLWLWVLIISMNSLRNGEIHSLIMAMGRALNIHGFVSNFKLVSFVFTMRFFKMWFLFLPSFAQFFFCRSVCYFCSILFVSDDTQMRSHQLIR